MADLTPTPGRTLRCGYCPHTLLSETPARIKHNADGSHELIPITPPTRSTDHKPRGRRRG